MTTRDGIFVTGGSGFVGRQLLTELLSLGRPLYVLDRVGSLRGPDGAVALTVVKGDLLERETYQSALRSCEVVIHLAAATGRAPASEHRRVNARGTELLLDECRAAGVTKILFVSSIASTFPINTGYHYADAKRSAEAAVSKSGLRFTILRPTLIVGPNAPNVKALEKLALLPVIVMPGNRRVRVQPIDVGDVVRSITGTIAKDEFKNETVEIGGPEVLTMEAFLQRIRLARTGRNAPVVHFPIGLLSVPLRVAEAAGLGRLLPISSGQLSSFRFDGVTAEHRSRSDAAIRDECLAFTRYLLSCDPDAYVVGRYAEANAVLAALAPVGSFDASLIGFAGLSPLCATVADSYCGVFFRKAALRKRLVLLLAILESRAPFSETIDRAVGGSMPRVFARLFITTVAAVLSLLAGTLIFGPTRLLLALVGRGSR
ncbi:MAG: NAD-dependent epimerase/dehydratase family protein [Vicinamibacterales bacterium]